MTMLRLLEHYVSTQGEGPKVGTPTQFVRFAGCNLKCPGWPCDTPFAVYPDQWNKEYVQVPLFVKDSPEGLVTQIEAKMDQASNVCLTGGEPLIQPRHIIEQLMQELFVKGMETEVFSNGTRRITGIMAEHATFVMDWKLRGSGDDLTAYAETRNVNVHTLAEASNNKQHAIKFVCNTESDIEEACQVYCDYELGDWPGTIYFGTVWGSDHLFTSRLVDVLLHSGLPKWKLNVQVHNFIWPAHERAR